jgi:hypothetical protein
MDVFTHDIKRAQWFELFGETACSIGSILYIIDAATNSQVLLNEVPILYLIGSIVFLLGSFLMIIQSIYTISNLKFNKFNTEEIKYKDIESDMELDMELGTISKSESKSESKNESESKRKEQ